MANFTRVIISRGGGRGGLDQGINEGGGGKGSLVMDGVKFGI